MNEETPTTPKPISPHSLTKQEMRASFLLPIAIIIGVWLAAALIYFFFPASGVAALAVVVLSLLLILLYWTRREPLRLRIWAIVLAIPALVGMGLGMVDGRLLPIFVGLGITVLLLALYRAISTPISYRFAYRSFRTGDYDQALQLVNKAITARPQHGESYQLKALIYLSQTDYRRAERAAREAIAHSPKQAQAHNILGQIHLTQAQFAAAQEAFAQAVLLDDRHALNWYYLGVCQYRQQAYAAAADSLLAAAQRTPRYVEFELLTFFYLWQTQLALQHAEKAAEIQAKLVEFAAGLTIWQENLPQQPDYPYKPLLAADVEQLAQLLSRDPQS